MRIGLALPHYDFSFPDGGPVTWERILAAAQRAESLGFDSAWISDHFFLDTARYGGTDEPRRQHRAVHRASRRWPPGPQRLRLGTLVACAPFRHPAHVAKTATALDLASGGRFDLGLGAGWYEREFEAFGYDFGSVGERFALLEESVAAIAALFGDESRSTSTGPHYRFRAGVQPSPAGDAGRAADLDRREGRAEAAPPDRPPRVGLERRVEGDARVACGARGRPAARPPSRRAATPRPSGSRSGCTPWSARTRRTWPSATSALRAWTPGGALDAVPLEEFARGHAGGDRRAVRRTPRGVRRLRRRGGHRVPRRRCRSPSTTGRRWTSIGERLVPAAHAIEA